MLFLLALLIGIIAGLRTMTAPAAVSIGAHSGLITLATTPLAFLGTVWAAGILVLLALGELVTDKLPATPSRKVPLQFGGRILSGALSGAALGAAGGALAIGLILGAIGAVIGTLGGAAARARLAAALGRDLPAALIEDAVAVGGAALIILSLR